MSLLLTIEHAPHPQPMRQARLDDGELVIGRSAEAGWQIDDPDKFVSREHCRIRAEPGGFVVTDMSSSGLFIDDASRPLGAGNTALLRDGMRLRMGEYVVGVDIGEDAEFGDEPRTAPLAEGSRVPVDFGRDDFFSSRGEDKPRPKPGRTTCPTRSSRRGPAVCRARTPLAGTDGTLPVSTILSASIPLRRRKAKAILRDRRAPGQ